MGSLRALDADRWERQAAPGAPDRAESALGGLLSMQRSAGNRAVAGMLKQRVGLQAKLDSGAGGDPHEAEADRVADTVTRPGVPPVVESAISSLEGHGRSLPSDARGPTERALGVDLGHVRVHADDRAHHLARGVGARAVTMGSDIYFKRGQLDSGKGAHLLAHELSHVVQQGGGSPGRGGPGVSAAPAGSAQLAIDEDEDDEPPPYTTTLVSDETDNEPPPYATTILPDEDNEPPAYATTILPEETDSNQRPPDYANIPEGRQVDQTVAGGGPSGGYVTPEMTRGGRLGRLWSRVKGAAGSAVRKAGAGLKSLAGKVRGLFGGSRPTTAPTNTVPAPNVERTGTRQSSVMYFVDDKQPEPGEANRPPADYANVVDLGGGAVQIDRTNRSTNQVPVQAPVQEAEPTRGVPVPNLAPGTKYAQMRKRDPHYAKEFTKGSKDLKMITLKSLKAGHDRAKLADVMKTHYGWKQEDCDQYLDRAERGALRGAASRFVKANLGLDQLEAEFTNPDTGWANLRYRGWSQEGFNRHKDQIRKYVEEFQANRPPDPVLPGVTEVDEGAERDKLKLHGGNPLTQGDATEPYSTSGSYSKFMGQGWSIFVMDSAGNLYAGAHKVGLFHHSSLLAGGDVAGAGEINVQDGQVKQVSNKSGHYKPLHDHAFQVLDELASRSVDLTQVVFCDATGGGDPKQPGNQFNAQEWYDNAKTKPWDMV